MIKAAIMAAVLLSAGAVQAQTRPASTPVPDQADRLLAAGPFAPVPAPVVNDGEAYHRADDAEQDPEELRTTRALNDEIVSRNNLAEAQDRADQAASEADRARYEADVAVANADRLTYEEDARRYRDDQARWQAERAQWEADVRACRNGDRARCAAPRG